MIDARTAHLIDARHLVMLVPHLGQQHFNQVREELAHHIQVSRSRDFDTWQEAWNDWTGARPERPGHIRFRTRRCPACNGRRIDHRHAARNLARTGNPMICGECRGTGAGAMIDNIALHAIVPSADPTGGAQ